MVHRPVNDFVTDQIRLMRLERGWRVEDMARRSGIPMGSYSVLETKGFRFSLENLLACQLALGAPIGRIWPVSYGKVSPVTPVALEAIVGQARGRFPQPMTLDRIVKAVQKEFGLTMEQLSSPSRDRPASRARMVAAAIAERSPGITQQAVAQRFLRDASVLSRGLWLAKQEPVFAEQVNRVQDQLDARLPDTTEKEWNQPVTLTVREWEIIRVNVRHLERIRGILKPGGSVGRSFDRVLRELGEITAHSS